MLLSLAQKSEPHRENTLKVSKATAEEQIRFQATQRLIAYLIANVS